MTTARRTALITGVGGQDGPYLARHLRARGWHVIGTVSSAGSLAAPRTQAYLDGVELVVQDVRDGAGMAALLERHRPAAVYNLAALSSVGQSWQEPDRARAVNADAVTGVLDALLAARDSSGHEVRFFQASSAEVHGGASDSPYAQAKAAAEEQVVQARERHGLYACFATLHNHESPLRDLRFVTRKVTRAAAEIAAGLRDTIELGNLEVSRDWGFAGDYVEAMELMLGADEPSDLPLGTGVAHSIGDLVVTAFRTAGVDDPWPHVRQDPQLFRPLDAPHIVADPEPAAETLGWRASTRFEELVAHMVDVDVRRLRTGIEESPAYLLPG